MMKIIPVLRDYCEDNDLVFLFTNSHNKLHFRENGDYNAQYIVDKDGIIKNFIDKMNRNKIPKGHQEILIKHYGEW